MKKLISIGVALALLAMVVVPGAVAAQTYPPDTYSKIPFSIIAEGIDLVGKLVTMANTKLALGLGFDADQFTTPIAEFTAGPMAWTVDMLAWGLEILEQVLDVALGEFMPEFAWLADVVTDIACKLYSPFGSLEVVCNTTP